MKEKWTMDRCAKRRWTMDKGRRTKDKRRRTILLCTALMLSVANKAMAISTERLADSLNLHYNTMYFHDVYVGDSLVHCVNPSAKQWGANKIRVKSLRVNGNSVRVNTDMILGYMVFSESELKAMRSDVSLWVLGNKKGNVKIYSKTECGTYELSELVPARLRQQKRKEKYPDYEKPNIPLIVDGSVVARPAETYKNGLSGRYIALWASHGLYYNQVEANWKWQRATMWTTVEDLYTSEYTRLVSEMLENAGAVVVQPRARIEGANLRLNSDNTWCLIDDGAGWEQGESGLPRWAEASRYWLQTAGFPDTIWGNDKEKKGNYEYVEDIRARGLWVNYLTGGSKANPGQKGLGIPVDVCLALHTDGQKATDDTTTIGTLAIYCAQDNDGRQVFGNGISRQLNRDLADYVQTQIVEDIRRTTEPRWTRRQLRNASYGEARYPVVPTALIEILNHSTMGDMRYGLDPQFRMTVARAIYKGLLRFLHEQDGREVIVEPLPVQKMQIKRAKTSGKEGTESIVLSWKPTADPIEPTAQPTHYYIYMREDTGQWERQRVEGTSKTFSLVRGKRYDMYVVAANGGGKSMKSEMLSAYFAPDKEAKTVLIVNNFNQTYGPRWFADSTYAGIVPNSYAVEDGYGIAYIGAQNDWTRSHGWKTDDDCGWGMCYRDRQATITIGNTHDYPTLHGRVLQEMGYSYISTNVEALTEIDSTMAIVDVIAGKECGTDTTAVLPENLQKALETYLQHGGKAMISGSYLGSGMSRKADKTWAESVLHYRLRAINATRNGRIYIPDNECVIRTEPNSEGLFAEAPEGIDAIGTRAVSVGRYQDMRVGAGVLWTGWSLPIVQSGNYRTAKTLVWGFPLEAAKDFDTIYKYSIQLLMSETATTAQAK
ncbi:MAG: hypothetical protein MR293_05040 [Bacteroidales bacterium]|nr:hypothetical protein [Bacteroidales bacterium]